MRATLHIHSRRQPSHHTCKMHTIAHQHHAAEAGITTIHRQGSASGRTKHYRRTPRLYSSNRAQAGPARTRNTYRHTPGHAGCSDLSWTTRPVWESKHVTHHVCVVRLGYASSSHSSRAVPVDVRALQYGALRNVTGGYNVPVATPAKRKRHQPKSKHRGPRAGV